MTVGLRAAETPLLLETPPLLETRLLLETPLLLASMTVGLRVVKESPATQTETPLVPHLAPVGIRTGTIDVCVCVRPDACTCR